MRRLLLALATLSACDPGEDERLWLISSPRLLAAASEPAEAPPGASVQISAIALGPGGPVDGGVSWGRCARRKPLTEPGPVDPACMRADPEALVPLGEGEGAALVVPPDACRLFGPDRPDPKPGEPAGRPADPDPSGGYYLPLRAALAGNNSVVFVRLKCNLDGATQEAAIAFERAHRPNQNPAVASFALRVGGSLREPDGGAVVVPRGARVELAVGWETCPAQASCGDGVCSASEEAAACPADCQPPRGCAGAEEYVFYDPSTQQISLRREQLRVSWYATAGALRDEASGASSPAGAGNEWTAPESAGEAWLAAVLRDDRGGVGHRFVRVRVE